MYRYILHESCSQFDSLPLTSLTILHDRYVATNLHSQLLYPVEHSGEAGCQRAPWKYDSVKCAALTVTVGAAAAHCMGFKGGGCRRLAERAMTECDQMSLDAYSDLQLELEQRRDVVFSQMLTAALTAFVDLVVVRWQDARWWATIAGRGWLLVIESLLSTQGAELGMVDDYAEGECSFTYRYILRDSCSQFDSLPLTSLTRSRFAHRGRRAAHRALAAPPHSERRR